MTKIITDASNYTAIANAIREKVGENKTYFPSEMADAILDISSGVPHMTSSEWSSLSFRQKKLTGPVIVGEVDGYIGTYYDYTNIGIETPYRVNDDHDNAVDIFDGEGFNFHGFYSNTVGDRCSAGGRGATWNNEGNRFVCNIIPTNNYGFFAAFALTETELVGSNISFYGVVKVNDFNMYVGGNIPGGWGNNSDVTLVHNGVTESLQSFFQKDEYTMYKVAFENDGLTFGEQYKTVLDSIYNLLLDGFDV